MKFSGAAFDRFLTNIGQDILWYASAACPCVNPASGAPDPACPLCVGKGRVWEKAVPTVVGIASQKTQEKWARSGMYETGDMVLSIPGCSPMWESGGQFDKVTTLNGTDGFSEVLFHGKPTERLRYAVKIITRVFWKGSDGSVVEGGIPAVDATGALSWPNGGEPPAGVGYSISGERYSEYFMLDAYPEDRNQHRGSVKLPKNVVVRKLSLYNHNSRTPTY